MATRSDDGLYLGVDVGTGSARAGLFDTGGVMRACAACPFETWRPQTDFVEQSSEDIWRAVCAAVRQASADAGADAAAVRGAGFDATCSLVLLDADDGPVTVSPTGRDEQNVVVWMDHRAIDQAGRINAGGHDVLRYVGGTISPEMQTPKLLWLKENLLRSWQRAARFFDLPDFLVYRATKHDVRSLCSTVCKWTYLGHRKGPEGGWDSTYFRAVGLGDLADEGYRRIGSRVRPMGEAVAAGLSEQSARELGLASGTAVGVSIIDAHAGGLGMLGAVLDDAGPARPRGLKPAAHGAPPAELDTRLALIGGTSSCHMAVSPEARYVPGVWGPYYSAMIPGMWLTEGGQSATGALIDHVVFSHARGAELRAKAAEQNRTVYELLNDRVAELGRTVEFPAALTRDLHVLPYFHGNRSPRADPTLRGVVSGLTLGDTVNDLALLYLATIQAVAHGTRHIIETLNQHGYRITTIFACGGGTKNPVFLREHADVTGCRVVLPREPEAVLLGAAILGAVAAGDFESVLGAMAALNQPGETLPPAGGSVAAYHGAKHAVFHHMYDALLAHRRIMANASPAGASAGRAHRV